ncbi:hypothetical protein [Methanolobus sp. WCC4]|uniref:hypothetical protein n=1 Tax=Methanolobus sp. WCC4 TaxID=3125784 RepID=UPI0030F72AB0
MITLGQTPRITLLKLVFEMPSEEIKRYLLDYLSQEEQTEIKRIAREARTNEKNKLFQDIKGFQDIPEERQIEFVKAAVSYAIAQGGASAANQKIISVEQCQEDIRKYGPTALRMHLMHGFTPGYQLIINGRYGY